MSAAQGKKTTVTIRLEDALDARIERLASETGRTKSYYLRLALLEFLERREDHILSIAALERGEPTVSMKTMDKLQS